MLVWGQSGGPPACHCDEKPHATLKTQWKKYDEQQKVQCRLIYSAIMKYPFLADMSSSGGLLADSWYGRVERGDPAEGGYAPVEGYALCIDACHAVEGSALSWDVCKAIECDALLVMMSARSISARGGIPAPYSMVA